MSVTKDMSIIKDIMIALDFKAVDYYKISGKWPFWYDDAMAWLREQYEQTSSVLSNSLNIGKNEIRENEGEISHYWTNEDERISADKELYEHIRNTCACIDDAMGSKSVVDINDYLEQARNDAYKAFECMEKRMETPKGNDGKISPKWTPKWTDEDEVNWSGIIDEIEANKSEAPDYDFETYDRFLSWLDNIKQRLGEEE